MNKSSKILIENRFDKPYTMMLEPWGEDYTLGMGEEFEIVVENCDADFYFAVQFNPDYVAVFIEGNGDYPSVFSKGEQIWCSYN